MARQSENCTKGWLLWVSPQSPQAMPLRNMAHLLSSILGDQQACWGPLKSVWVWYTLTHYKAHFEGLQQASDGSKVQELYKNGPEQASQVCRLQGTLVVFLEEAPLITSLSCVSLWYLSILLMGLHLGVSHFFIVSSICLLIILCHIVTPHTHTHTHTGSGLSVWSENPHVS
jgi:hypothetical protein